MSSITSRSPSVIKRATIALQTQNFIELFGARFLVTQVSVDLVAGIANIELLEMPEPIQCRCTVEWLDA